MTSISTTSQKVRMENTLSPSIFSPLPESNAENSENAQVVIFLVNHKKKEHEELISLALSHFKLTNEDILLVESPNSIGKWNFNLIKDSWEDTEILAQVQKKQNQLLFIKKVISQLDENLHPLKTKVEICKLLLCLEGRECQPGQKQVLANFKIEQLSSWLNNPSENMDKIKNFQKKAIFFAEHLYKRLRNMMVTETFGPRQNHLIEKIKSCLSFNKIFITCGACHANVKTSNFPLEAQRLISFLESSTTFVIYDLS